MYFGYYIINFPGLCVSTGLNLYVTAPCATGLYSVLVLSTTDTVVLGTNPVTSQNFEGFVSNIYIYSDLLSSLLTSTSTPSGSNNPLCTSGGVTCNCGVYSCINNDANDCNTCDASCGDTCTVASSSSSCINVQSICSPSYYDAALGACDTSITAISNCAVQSSSTVCTQCNSGYYQSPSQEACCLYRYYYNAGSCAACSSDCYTCSGGLGTECLSCVSGAAVTGAGSCECSDGYYESAGSPLACAACSGDCATCSGGTSSDCLSCGVGAGVVAGSCLCESGYFTSQVGPLVCTACDSSCLTCSGSTSSDCLTCSGGAAAVAGVCGGCSSGFYASQLAPLVCTACDPNCASCSGGSSSDCQGCVANASTANPGACLCDQGYYQSAVSPLVCTSCNADCSQCSAGTSSDCLQCADVNAGSTSPGPCICNAGYFASQTSPLVCTLCGVECATCINTSSNCQSCAEPNAAITLAGSCICSSGYYASSTSPLSCTACSADCSTCSAGTSSDCWTCTDPGASTSMSPGPCFCQSAYYTVSTSPLVCGPCQTDCATCSGSTSEDCLTCAGTSASTLGPGPCLCGTGLFADSFSPISCEHCNINCKTCAGEGISDCLSCMDSNAFVNGTNGVGECLCNDYYYAASSSPLMCARCSSECLHCVGAAADECISCVAAHASTVDNSSECLCTEGYYNSSVGPLECRECDVLCRGCTGPSEYNCTSCNDHQDLIDGACICVGGFIMNYTTGLCGSCILHCIECTNTSTCTSCSSGYYYDSDEYQCRSCQKSCKECSGPAPNQCISCSNSMVTPSNKTSTCVCNSNQYEANMSPLICLDCDDGCDQCNATQCFNCSIGFQLNGSVCERKELFLTISSHANNSLLFEFSENLQTILTTSDFSIYYTSQVLDYKIISLSNRAYLIELTSFPSATGIIALLIQFNNQLIGASNSLLAIMQYSTSINLIQSTDLLSQTLQKINTVISVLAAGSAMSSIALNNQPSLVWASLNTAQILCYVPLQNIALPTGLHNFLMSIQPINILPNYWISTGIYNCTSSDIQSQFLSYGYTCNYFITNTGELLLVLVVYLSLFPCLVLLYITTSGKAKNYFLIQIKGYRWNLLIRFWIEGFLDMMIACIITMNTVRNI